MARDVSISLRQLTSPLLSLIVAVVTVAAGACGAPKPPAASDTLPPLPPPVREKLSTHLGSTRSFDRHVWRDTPSINSDSTVTGYVEISRGESAKWEFRIPFNRREVDRMIPASLGGYPTNYGFLPQTISYDGDPADVLVLGPALAGGQLVKGAIVGLMRMTDTGDLDSKVVISPVDSRLQPTHALDAGTQRLLSQFFSTYKRHEGKVTDVPGFGGPDEARRFLETTAAFFEAGRRER